MPLLQDYLIPQEKLRAEIARICGKKLDYFRRRYGISRTISSIRIGYAL